jgi:hypothetical protein
MSTLAVSIQAQIDALDAVLATVAAVSVSSDGTSIVNQRWTELSDQRLKLEMLLNRVNGPRPMFVRGVVKGLSNGSV